MITIGLTGGIGAGKSSVAKILAELGAPVINADEIGHSVYLPGEPAYRELIDAFGQEIVASDGTIDRKRLGAIVFSDAEALRRLNSIVHPRIHQRLREMIAAMRKQGEARPIVIEAAVLIEAGWHDLCQQIWVITAPREEIIRRLESQRGLRPEEIRARIEAQLSDDERRKLAVAVIENNQGFEELREKVRALWEKTLDESTRSCN